MSQHFFPGINVCECKIRLHLLTLYLILFSAGESLHIQGPSWPRILGRSDFSLQEN